MSTGSGKITSMINWTKKHLRHRSDDQQSHSNGFTRKISKRFSKIRKKKTDDTKAPTDLVRSATISSPSRSSEARESPIRKGGSFRVSPSRSSKSSSSKESSPSKEVILSSSRSSSDMSSYKSTFQIKPNCDRRSNTSSANDSTVNRLNNTTVSSNPNYPLDLNPFDEDDVELVGQSSVSLNKRTSYPIGMNPFGSISSDRSASVSKHSSFQISNENVVSQLPINIEAAPTPPPQRKKSTSVERYSSINEQSITTKTDVIESSETIDSCNDLHNASVSTSSLHTTELQEICSTTATSEEGTAEHQLSSQKQSSFTSESNSSISIQQSLCLTQNNNDADQQETKPSSGTSIASTQQKNERTETTNSSTEQNNQFLFQSNNITTATEQPNEALTVGLNTTARQCHTSDKSNSNKTSIITANESITRHQNTLSATSKQSADLQLSTSSIQNHQPTKINISNAHQQTTQNADSSKVESSNGLCDVDNINCNIQRNELQTEATTNQSLDNVILFIEENNDDQVVEQITKSKETSINEDCLIETSVSNSNKTKETIDQKKNGKLDQSPDISELRKSQEEIVRSIITENKESEKPNHTNNVSTNPFDDDDDDGNNEDTSNNNHNTDVNLNVSNKNSTNPFDEDDDDEQNICQNGTDSSEVNSVRSPTTSTPLSTPVVTPKHSRTDFTSTLPTPIPRRNRRLHGSTTCLQPSTLYPHRLASSTLSLNTTFDCLPLREDKPPHNAFNRSDGGRGSISTGSIGSFRRDGVMASLPPSSRTLQRKKRRAPLPPSQMFLSSNGHSRIQEDTFSIHRSSSTMSLKKIAPPRPPPPKISLP